jgi:methylenetetrahydrofolate reductase (NADPH)
MMAYRQEETVAEIIQKSGVLQGRVPWYPGRDQPKPQDQPSKETA